MRAAPVLALLLAVAACSAREPEYDVSQVSEDASVAVIAEPDAAPAGPGLFGWLRGGGAAQDTPVAVSEQAPRPGLLARLFGGGGAPGGGGATPVEGAALADSAETAETVDGAVGTDGPESAVASTDPPTAFDADPPRRGFLAALFGPRPPADALATAAEVGTPQAADEQGTDPEATGAPSATRPPEVIEVATGGRPQGGGFLAGLFGAPAAAAPMGATAVDPAEIRAGDALDYGRIRRVCDVSGPALGTRIAQNAATGHALHDTEPGSTELRSFHLTGFSDGCAREFSAALAMFGSLSVYESIRFGAPSATQPLAATDTEYDRIKRAICSVGPDTPCGDRLSALESRTAFVSIYERLGSNPRWKNLLLHDGEVAALDIKTR